MAQSYVVGYVVDLLMATAGKLLQLLLQPDK